MPSPPYRGQLYKGFGAAFAMAVELVALVVLGYLLGRFLDGKLGTAPWLGLSFLLLGAAGGFLRLYYHSKMEEESGVPKRGSGRPTG